jgi:hypothetical protein
MLKKLLSYHYFCHGIVICLVYVEWCWTELNCVAVRLTSEGDRALTAGTVELFKSSYWYQVCDADWDDTDARVACREMGFADGKALQQGQVGKRCREMGDHADWIFVAFALRLIDHPLHLARVRLNV